jgi:hypothetical protein
MALLSGNERIFAHLADQLFVIASRVMMGFFTFFSKAVAAPL